MPTKLRITDNILPTEEVLRHLLTFTKEPDTAIIVKEQEPYPHYHCYYQTSYSPPTIRERLKEIYSKIYEPARLHTTYSVSTNHTDWDFYKGYLFKNENTEILHCNYNIEELRNYYNQKNPITKKKTELFKICEDLERNGLCNYIPKEITKAVLKMNLRNGKIINLARVAQIVQTIYYLKNPEDELLISSVLRKAEMEDHELLEVDHLRMENKQLKSHLRDYLRKNDPE
tara:strand:+ start:258 stop:944 length:687 start_codon:yes stop_codon:yes gene_type:complete